MNNTRSVQERDLVSEGLQVYRTRSAESQDEFSVNNLCRKRLVDCLLSWTYGVEIGGGGTNGKGTVKSTVLLSSTQIT